MAADITQPTPISGNVADKCPERSVPPVLPRQPHLEPVRRRYGPACAVVDELVEVLYQLLMQVPVDAPSTVAGAQESPCVSAAHE
jgi:hypothetical protein